jgi:UDP-N-acetylglucosamine 2-epimerase (non-hydrolysing)
MTDIMNGRLKMLVVAGARPNFMKVAPLLKAALAHNAQPGNEQRAIDCLLVHTGQHYDEKMSDVFFRELGIPAPDVNLDVGSGSHAVQTANVMLKFEPVCKETKPDWVVVVGDVNSTVACTLVAAKLGIRVAHVEAGLRSFDRAMPEEINRLVTDALADLLLTPSSDADLNLLNEGIPKSRIRLVGNIMIDSLIANLEKARQSKILKTLELTPGKFAFVTLHRPSNVDSQASLTALMRQLRSLSTQLPIVFPMHPRTRKMLETFQIDSRSDRAFQIIEPVGYHDSLCLAENARIVLTDSGGLQEETTYFQTPCLTLRPNTERPVTVTIGSNMLTGLENLEQDLSKVLSGGARTGQIPPMWDGATAARCLKAILDVSQEVRDAGIV